MNLDLDDMRLKASILHRRYNEGDSEAIARIRRHHPNARDIRFSDALNLVARDAAGRSWAELRSEHEFGAMDLGAKRDRLKIALFYGQHWVVDRLLGASPETPRGDLGLEIALYDLAAVLRAVKSDPSAASSRIGVRTPILHLAFSRHIHAAPDRKSDMISIAELLLENGADPNDGFPVEPGSPHMLSALYGAVGHADNLPLVRWLLENGADPNDGESLYHSTENGHLEGPRLLLTHGAAVEGTNALLRAMDFNDHELVRLLLKHCSDPNITEDQHPSGEPTLSVPVMHQAARRLCDGKMANVLLKSGADPDAVHLGRSAYAVARMYGNKEVARELRRFGASTRLSETEALLAAVADDLAPASAKVKHVDLPEDIRAILPNILRYPGRLEHCKRLVSLGFDFEQADEMDVSPVQIAGWEGLPDAMEWLLSLGPDLDHVNGFGGNLLSTVIHGSENCPERSRRDHVKCAALALESGVPLPVPAINLAGEEKMAEFLTMWSEDHPERVTSDGIG